MQDFTVSEARSRRVSQRAHVRPRRPQTAGEGRVEQRFAASLRAYGGQPIAQPRVIKKDWRFYRRSGPLSDPEVHAPVQRQRFVLRKELDRAAEEYAEARREEEEEREKARHLRVLLRREAILRKLYLRKLERAELEETAGLRPGVEDDDLDEDVGEDVEALPVGDVQSTLRWVGAETGVRFDGLATWEQPLPEHVRKDRHFYGAVDKGENVWNRKSRLPPEKRAMIEFPEKDVEAVLAINQRVAEEHAAELVALQKRQRRVKQLRVEFQRQQLDSYRRYTAQGFEVPEPAFLRTARQRRDDEEEEEEEEEEDVSSSDESVDEDELADQVAVSLTIPFGVHAAAPARHRNRPQSSPAKRVRPGQVQSRKARAQSAGVRRTQTAAGDAEEFWSKISTPKIAFEHPPQLAPDHHDYRGLEAGVELLTHRENSPSPSNTRQRRARPISAPLSRPARPRKVKKERSAATAQIDEFERRQKDLVKGRKKFRPHLRKVYA